MGFFEKIGAWLDKQFPGAENKMGSILEAPPPNTCPLDPKHDPGVPQAKGGGAPDRVLKCTPASSLTLNGMCQKSGAAWGVDPLLIRAVCQIESSGGLMLHSGKSTSYGLMQINCGHLANGELCSFPGQSSNPFTQRVNTVTAEMLLTDCELNIDLGAQLLSQLIAAFSGDLALAIAAYNVGQGKIQAHPIPDVKDAYGNNPFAYVKKVSAAYVSYGGTDFFKGGNI